MIFNGMLMTGTRMFSYVESIELWKTDENVQLTMGEGAKVLLDEDESRVVRRWAELNMQAAVTDAQLDVMRLRCDLQDEMNRAEKLNRKAKRKAPAKRLPAKVLQLVVEESLEVAA